MHIMMADDDRDDYLLVEHTAAKYSIDITINYASNWLELWRNLLKELPDALLLDLNMPVKDGFECLQLIRSDEKFKDLPVIIYTTSTSKIDIEKAYDHGANYYIAKPVNIEGLVYMLKTITSMNAGLLSQKPSRQNFVIVLH